MIPSVLSNPLPAMWEAFETSESALKVARKTIRQPQSQKADCQDELFKYQRRLLNKTTLFPIPANAEFLITDCQTESQDLFILGLWATSERFIRKYLQQKSIVIQQYVQPPTLGNSFYQYLYKEIEYWKPTDILDFLKESLFTTQNDKNLIGLAKQILVYRDWVAHGKNPHKLPSATHLKPKQAYDTLNKIINILLQHYP